LNRAANKELIRAHLTGNQQLVLGGFKLEMAATTKFKKRF
jgi:hypothetical protein